MPVSEVEGLCGGVFVRMKRVNFNQRYPPGYIGDQETVQERDFPGFKVFQTRNFVGRPACSFGSHVQTGTLSVT